MPLSASGRPRLRRQGVRRLLSSTAPKQGRGFITNIIRLKGDTMNIKQEWLKEIEEQVKQVGGY